MVDGGTLLMRDLLTRVSAESRDSAAEDASPAVAAKVGEARPTDCTCKSSARCLACIERDGLTRATA